MPPAYYEYYALYAFPDLLRRQRVFAAVERRRTKAAFEAELCWAWTTSRLRSAAASPAGGNLRRALDDLGKTLPNRVSIVVAALSLSLFVFFSTLARTARQTARVCRSRCAAFFFLLTSSTFFFVHLCF
ncbi:hypothetical protein MRX96_029733 [Rhipicephalus microplus]